MTAKLAIENPPELTVTIEDVNRLLDTGRLLLSVLTPEELDQFQQLMDSHVIENQFIDLSSSKCDSEIGNTGVT